MFGKRRLGVLGLALAVGVGVVWFVAGKSTAQSQRDAAKKAYKDGNYKDAYEAFRKLALDANDDPGQVGDDLDMAIQSLHQLGRSVEDDAFREAVIEVHKKNWRLLAAAARSYLQAEHYGYIVAGKFERGHRPGGGRFVNVQERDRVRALQLLEQAQELTKNETDKPALGAFYLQFADTVQQHEAWRLQYLTDLKQLPDYGDPQSHGDKGAPVDDKGDPIFHHLPKSYETAQSDGERWRWLLMQAAEFDPARVNDIDLRLAAFLQRQFDVQTLAQFGRFDGEDEDAGKDKTGIFALHTLGDDETIARLANGVKRFKLPDEFNWIKIFERVAGRGKSKQGEQARDALAQTYENRRQYVKSAAAWRKAIAEYGERDEGNRRTRRLEQIVGNWGRFETGQAQPAGKNAIVDFRFRNGNKVSFEATAINVARLLDDVKAYLRGNPRQVDWNKVNIANIGYRLVEEQARQYLGAKVAAWDLELKPRAEHNDSLVTVNTPLTKPGAYLVTGRMANGNVSRIIVWVADTVIVKKMLEGKVLYYVADAVTGQPVARANVEFFGWRNVGNRPPSTENRIETVNLAEFTDADGQVRFADKRQNENYQWLVIARKGGSGQAENRLAYLGFTHVWLGAMHDQEYNQAKTYLITDRPVYRPDQKVQFKFWVRHTKYDQADTSTFARLPFKVQIHNPKGEKILEKTYTSDEYGGLAGEYVLPKGAMLGVYGIHIVDQGGGSFRVEEYKKPEFEVTVEAPREPVSLGEAIVATVQAKYYFGAPVTSARVKYKVTRTSYESRWYPRGAWDWFYGPGYWWFAADYAWFPGWGEWGCFRPIPPWWGGHQGPPEIVAELDVPIGPDGTVRIPINTQTAKDLHGDQDHQYTITAEVVDESRRTIVGTGTVLVARKPFRVFAWVDHGHYRAGDTIKASFSAQTLDRKPIEGKGELTLRKITYDDKQQPVEKTVETWKLDTDAQGQAQQQLKAAEPGQYRLAYRVTDAKQHTMEGGYVFVVRGQGFDGHEFRFNDLELITDKREYAPGEKVKLLVNTNRNDGVVLLFVRPTNGIYLAPKVLRLKGKCAEEEIAVVQKDMPNFFIEAVTVADGKVHMETREVIVPPEKRVLNVEVLPSQQEYKPGQKATVKLRLTDFFGKPFIGSTVLSVYDRSVEYISGGSNVPEIREFFWKWRRHHYPQTETSLAHWLGNLQRSSEIGMSNLGMFGDLVVEQGFHRLGDGMAVKGSSMQLANRTGGFGGGGPMAPGAAAPMEGADKDGKGDDAQPTPPAAGVEPTVRKNFADTAFWSAALTTDADGTAEISLTMPENLTGWKVKAWAMGHGTKVGQGEAEVVTKKDLLVRLQAPRFFMQKDEVVLSANVHNYLKTDKDVSVALELDGPTLVASDAPRQQVRIPAGGEKRVDWRVKVQTEGEAIVRVKAITDEESDAMEMRFPSYVHGLLKTDSFSAAIRPDKPSTTITLSVPAERRINESRLEVRYSPTLAGAMVDALPYLVDYPYGCTEQTLNRFLPTVITQRILQKMNLDLKAIRDKRTNLNAQEIGDDKARAQGWKRFPRNPVFDEDEVREMARAGVQALTAMQCSDGGWGWFSGYGEHSFPHTSAIVVHGLQIARDNDIALVPGVLERGVEWLKRYQAEQIQHLNNAPSQTKPWKETADNLDALVYMVLVDSGVKSEAMRDFLYRDRTHLAVYAKAMFGLTLHKEDQAEKLAMILKNIEQYLVQDDENQTAYLRLPAENSWWCWYGSDIEANAYYLKLLTRTNPKDERASRLVKYLLNNRKHATWWNSTRDTAVCIEALADYLKASGEDRPDMTVEVWLDGKKHKEVKIDRSNLFTFDNQFVLAGDAIESGKHTLEIKRQGTGPVYVNAYLTNFTLEDFITRAGLEVKVNRKYYKLTRADKDIKVSGSRGQALDQKVERYVRTELQNLAQLKSGDLVEIELEIDSKNDYEYLIFEDPKAAGFEPMLVRSGYNPNDLGAYMELRDDKVCFFVRQLARGRHSVSYRMRAEIPGRFSALPTSAYAMYAPELKGNSDEIKVLIAD